MLERPVIDGKINLRKNGKHLLLPCGFAMWIELPELECAEQLLDRRAGIAVRCGVDDPEPQPPQMLFRLWARMVSGAVEQEDGIVSPHGHVLIQLVKQMLKEQQHDVAVGVGLRQCEPYLTICIYCRDERQSWTDSLHRY